MLGAARPRRATRQRPASTPRCKAPLAFALALLTGGCMGTGTKRIDASCHEMRAAVAYELLKDNPGVPILDVRAPREVTPEEMRFAGSIAVPLEWLPSRSHELDRYRNTTIVVFGRDGEAGRKACQLLSGWGFRYVVYVSDGAEGWYRSRLPGMPRAPGATPSPEAASGQ